MNKRMLLRGIGFFAALVLAHASPGFAASTISVSSPGGGVFVMQGTMEGVSALDITVSYDTATLSGPRVDQGALLSGALMAVNANTPGMVRMAVVRVSPVQGSGVLATLTFTRTGASPGKITALSARLSNFDGQPLPVTVQVMNPPADAGSSSSSTASQTREEQRTSSPTSSPSSPSTTAATPMVGIVTEPHAAGEGANGHPALPEGQGPLPEEPNDPVVVAGKPGGITAMPQTPEKNIHTLPSALDRFQDYSGELSPKSALALFDQDGALGFRQEPSVVLADGKATARVMFIAEPGRKGAPDVVVTGAKLVSMRKDPDYTNTWVVELTPEKGAFRASLSVPLEKLTVVFPLTVAPLLDVDLDKSGKVNEADFALFLKKKSLDLNGDGKRDYLDAYLFTANYLVEKKPR